MFNWKSFLLFLLLVFCSMESVQSRRRRLLGVREKREALIPPPLVYPYGGTVKLLVGCAIPIAMPGRILVHGQNFQVQYSLPQNASFFTDYFKLRSTARELHQRRRRHTDIVHERSVFYQFIEQELQRKGGPPGKDCMKRSICESAETPLRDDGLVGEILHVLLTPDYGESCGSVDEEYRIAAEVGRRGEDCFKAYPSCPKGFGILDHISEVFYRD